MVDAAKIGWGSYRQYEGPYHMGKCPFVLPAEPTAAQKQMAVITATEGGKFDAWNGYDVCGWTSGLIQWCEGRGQYSVSDMLGAVADVDRSLIRTVDDLADEFDFNFVRNNKGRYRFINDKWGEVDTDAEQKKLFFMGVGDGTKGSWNSISTTYAKRWAAAISTVWESSVAQDVQARYTADRLKNFLMPYAKSVFDQRPNTREAEGLYAGYLSFAANNPTWASTSLSAGVLDAKAAGIAPWTNDWVAFILRSLTFTPNVAIYPHRYDSIRPVLEKLYGLQLPDMAKELKAWTARTGIPAGVNTVEIQQALLKLGYDLGPKGADGVYGNKTKEAVLTFEQTSGLVPSPAWDGQVDEFTWPALQKKLEQLGGAGNA